MSANKGFDETLTVPQNHKDATAGGSKSFDSHFRTLNIGMINTAKNVATMQIAVAELAVSTKNMSDTCNRIDSIEKTLIGYGKILADIVDSLHKLGSVTAVREDVKGDDVVTEEVEVTEVTPVITDTVSEVKVTPVVTEPSSDAASLRRTQSLTKKPTRIVLSAPIVTKMASVKTDSPASSGDDAAADNDDIEITDSDEDGAKPVAKAKLAPVVTKKKPVVKRGTFKK